MVVVVKSLKLCDEIMLKSKENNSRFRGINFLDYHPSGPTKTKKGGLKPSQLDQPKNLVEATKLMQLLQDEQIKNEAQRSEISRLNSKIVSKNKYHTDLKSEILQLKADIEQKVQKIRVLTDSTKKSTKNKSIQTEQGVEKSTQTQQHPVNPQKSPPTTGNVDQIWFYQYFYVLSYSYKNIHI